MITRITPLRSNLRILRISKVQHAILAERLGNLLRYQVIAYLFLVVHYSEVVVVAGTEHAVGHDLVLSLPALYDPEGSAARLETIIDYVSSVNKR